MKYFILDFKDELCSLSSDGVEALRRATQYESSEIIQFGRDDYLKYPQPILFFDNIVDQLHDSDIIIAFSANNLLRFWNNAAEFRDTLFEKINNRTPFYLQFLQMLESNLCGSEIFHSTNYYTELIDMLEVYPTGIQVRGCFTGHTRNFEPAKVDPCLSAVFEEGKKIWIDGANLMRFGEGATPLLKSSANHRNVSTLDPSAGLIDYEKLSPFVIRYTDDHFGHFGERDIFCSQF